MITMDMSGRVSLITGAGGGIGGGIAQVFARSGAKVYVADLEYADAKVKADQIHAEGGMAEAVGLDVTRKDDVYALIDRIEKDNGKIDHLVNCAGIAINKPYMESTDDEFRKILEVNLISVDNCCKAALQKMIPRKEGKIVNILSASSRMGSDFFSHYSSSKFGLLGLTQSIGLAVARHNINVNGICPGIIVTKLGEKQGGGLVEQLSKRSGKPREMMEDAIKKSIPLRRFQSGEDIGHMALFLCSELASNITCQAINVCGGMRMN
ncbi:MAG: SDR family oxidoreductase [Proteobacteria bacterium]|nr:SDR family oxidoreductase [Pseudomonadota bacterium]MBU1388605.1 SDR family oxidoreductase [Pseudomonadota bacterium]MBU1541761.1 SDR family oxidoreductase [Pseudomonadota bacterium]MBU2429254.1 SDR family oxidoreductase [Pseudomonadota bacterium]MBU2482339.1 SDR family oxidoreductase [Pseudomonadota bacterium]